MKRETMNDIDDIERELEQRMNEKADEARNEKAGEPPRDVSWRSLIQPRDLGTEGVSGVSRVDTAGHLPDCASMRNRFGAPLASCNCVELMHQARAALEGVGHKVPNITQCAKCGMDVHGEELCGWCEAAVLRVALAEAQRERDEAHKDLSEKCLALAMETVAHAKTKLALEEAQRTAGDVFENLDLNSLNRSLDEARADAERLREALEGLLREEWMTYEGNLEATGHASVDDLNAARAVLASTPSVEPEGPDYSGLCFAPECGGHCGYVHAVGCEAIREYMAEHGGDPYKAPSRLPSASPTPRDMRVAEAVANSMDEPVRELLEEEECDCSPEWPRCALHRLALRRRSLDLAAVVAKAVKP